MVSRLSKHECNLKVALNPLVILQSMISVIKMKILTEIEFYINYDM